MKNCKTCNWCRLDCTPAERNRYPTCLNCLYLKIRKQNGVFFLLCQKRMWENANEDEKLFKVSDQELRGDKIRVRKIFFTAKNCPFFENMDGEM